MTNQSRISTISVRKGRTELHIGYGATYTNNLSGYETRFRNGPVLEIAVDLNPNHRTRNKSTKTYRDTQDLVHGGIKDLKVLQFTDTAVVDAILTRLGSERECRLSLELEGTRTFDVRVETSSEDSGLFLRVRRGAFEPSTDK